MEAKKEKKTSAKKKLADVGIDRRDSSRKPSNVSPTETADLYICTYLVLTIHTTEAERGFRCHDEHSTVKTRERSRLSQERLERSHEWCFSIKYYREQLLLWVSFWYETKARRFVHLDTWLSSIVKPDPEFDQLARNDYVFGKSASQQDVAKYEVAVVKAVENRDQFDLSSISSDIKPSEKEASKLPQIMKKIAKADPQLAIRLWSFLTYCFYFMFIKLLSAKDKLPRLPISDGV